MDEEMVKLVWGDDQFRSSYYPLESEERCTSFEAQLTIKLVWGDDQVSLGR